MKMPTISPSFFDLSKPLIANKQSALCLAWVIGHSLIYMYMYCGQYQCWTCQTDHTILEEFVTPLRKWLKSLYTSEWDLHNICRDVKFNSTETEYTCVHSNGNRPIRVAVLVIDVFSFCYYPTWLAVRFFSVVDVTRRKNSPSNFHCITFDFRPFWRKNVDDENSHSNGSNIISLYFIS